jgi:hypothetical protein
MAFVLWPNVIFFVCFGIVVSILGFIVYGSVVGFENTLKEFENKDLSCDSKDQPPVIGPPVS